MKTFASIKSHIKNLLESPSEELGRAGRFLAYQLRLWRFCGRMLVRDRLPTVAGDLTFKTILGLVPAFVLLVLVVNLLSEEPDISRRLQQQIYRALNISEINMTTGSEEVSLSAKIDALVSDVRANVTAAATIGLVFLVILALSVVAGAERAMNQIWRAVRGRRIWRRVRMYWIVLTLGPVSALAAAYLSAWLDNWFVGRTPGVQAMGKTCIDLLATWFVLYLMYTILPNIPVRHRAALTGAVVAGTVWTLLARPSFSLYVRYAVGYRQLFGSLSVVPIFFVWIYVSWLIVLFGCELAYVVQNLGDLSRAEKDERGRNRFLAADFVCMKVTLAASQHFLAGTGPVTLEELRRTVGVSPVDLRSVLEALMSAHLLVEVPVGRRSREDVGYIPARAPDRIQLREVTSVAELLQPEPFTDSPTPAQAAADKLYKSCVEAREGVLGDRTLADLVSADEADGRQAPGSTQSGG